MTDKMEELGRRIAALPGADVDFSTFPSGSAMLDVRRNGRLYVMAYSPAGHFGVDEVRDGEGFLLSYRFTSADFEPAAERLWELLGEKPQREKAGLATPGPGAVGGVQPAESSKDLPQQQGQGAPNAWTGIL